MKIKASVVGLIAATTLFAVGTTQAACHKSFLYHSGWHMVSKKCHIQPAGTWQEYNSGIYTQPIAKDGFMYR